MSGDGKQDAPRDISHELFVGALVDWLHTPRGGYGFAIRIPAEIVSLNLMGTRAVIKFSARDGTRVKRTILHNSLRWRNRQ